MSLTADGALDGIADVTEVLYGAVGKPYYDKMTKIAGSCLDLVVNYLPRAVENPKDEQARHALCLATDLGGYAIMVGGTSGPHLTSFSLVDILSHSRACCIIITADCWDGIPDQGDYGRLLHETPNLEALLDKIRNPGFHQQDMWQVQIQALICLKADVYLHTQNLSDVQIKNALIKPCGKIEETVSEKGVIKMVY